MDLTHRFTVPAGRDEAWTAFTDLERVAPCFPGMTVDEVDGDTFSGSVKIKFGAVTLDYAGSGRYVDRDQHRGRMVVEATGRDKRGNGTATVTATITLSERGEQTEVEVRSDLSLTGKPAQLGRGVIADVNDKVLDQFADCVSGRFGDEATSPSSSDSDPAHTVELDETPGDVQSDPTAAESGRGGSWDGVDAPPDIDTTPESTPPPPRPTPSPPAYSYTPPKDSSQSDFHALATVVPPLLRRYWKPLAGGGVALLIVAKVVQGARR